MLRIPYSTLYGCINAVLLGHSIKSEEEVILVIHLKNKDRNKKKHQSEQADGISDSMEEFKENEWVGQTLTAKLNEVFASTSMPVIATHVPCNTKDVCKSLAKNKMWISYEVGRVNMAPQEIAQNIKLAIRCIVSCLDNNWDDIRALHLKSLSGQHYRLY